uniref:Uncharacterized protein n=1 Tax=Physcomitrium patens TaxID=3218 RepID=A0A2K1J2A9_PHYPA|nr:hypothetical protein PHYPA_021515 [Physcomitrium patens]
MAAFSCCAARAARSSALRRAFSFAGTNTGGGLGGFGHATLALARASPNSTYLSLLCANALFAGSIYANGRRFLGFDYQFYEPLE